jgi:hypothetical protein
MLAEIARPITLVLCILSLYAVFHSAFLVPASNVEQRIEDTLAPLALAAGIALVSGLIFREAMPKPSARSARLSATLPVQMFCWASGIMLILFLVSWYLEAHCIFYRDVRIWG